MAKTLRLLAAFVLAFGTLPTHLAIATSAAPIPEVDDLSPLYLRAVNPGYTMGGVSNTGELIELTNSTDSPLPLQDYSLWYNNGKNDYLIIQFPESSYLSPGSLVLRLQSSPEVKNALDVTQVAHLTYAKTLATSGTLTLYRESPTGEDSSGEETSNEDTSDEDTRVAVDEVCWLGKGDCLPAFQSNAPTTIVRDVTTGKFVAYDDYVPDYFPANYFVLSPDALDAVGDTGDTSNPTSSTGSADSDRHETTVDNNPTSAADAVDIADVPETSGISGASEDSSTHGVSIVPGGSQPTDNSNSAGSPNVASTPDATVSPDSSVSPLVFTEVLTFYSESVSEQFIELYNPTDKTVSLRGYQIRYKNKFYHFDDDASIAPQSYFIYRSDELTLTKNPTTSNTLELFFGTTKLVSSLEIPHGQKKSLSYAYFPEEKRWLQTHHPTPGAKNIYQEFQTCPPGKIINEETGNCITDTSLITAELVPCADGYERNPETNRCRKVATEATSKLTPCAEGYERNPETNRCRKIATETSAELAPCAEGYERNPETNRCRKIKTNDGADYALTPITGVVEQKSFISLWAVLALALLGVGCLIFQFRREIAGFFRKLKS